MNHLKALGIIFIAIVMTSICVYAYMPSQKAVVEDACHGRKYTGRFFILDGKEIYVCEELP